MQQRSEVTRKRILTSALKLFAQVGYDSTGVAEICKEAGMSKGAFYHHFPTKQAVFLTLLTDWLEELDTRLRSVRKEGKSVPQSLVDMTEEVKEVFQLADGQLPMFLEFWTQASHNPEVWKATIQPYHRYQQYFAGLIREGIAEGSLRPIDPDAAARTIVSMAVGLLLQGVLDPTGAKWDQEATKSMQLLIDGMARSAA